MNNHILLTLLGVFALCSCAMSGTKDISGRTPQSVNTYGGLPSLGIIIDPRDNIDRNLFDVYEVKLRIKGNGVAQLLQKREAGPRVDVIFDIYNKEIEINSLVLFPYDLGVRTGRLKSFSWVTVIDDEEIQGVKKVAIAKDRMKIDGYVDIRVSEFDYTGSYYDNSKPTIVVKERLGKTQPDQWKSSSNAQSDYFQYVVTVKKL